MRLPWRAARPSCKAGYSDRGRNYEGKRCLNNAWDHIRRHAIIILTKSKLATTKVVIAHLRYGANDNWLTYIPRRFNANI